MAKGKTGFHKDNFDVAIWEVFRGGGRQLGRDIVKGTTKEIRKRTLDTNSKYRKQIERFTLPGTAKGAITKLYTLIDSFHEEYTNTKTLLNKTMYIESDVQLIEQKIEYTSRLIWTEQEEKQYNKLKKVWDNIKVELNIL